MEDDQIRSDQIRSDLRLDASDQIRVREAGVPVHIIPRVHRYTTPVTGISISISIRIRASIVCIGVVIVIVALVLAARLTDKVPPERGEKEGFPRPQRDLVGRWQRVVRDLVGTQS